MAVRVPGEGDAPISGKGPKGDLLVRVNVASSKAFRRQGVNLHHEARIPLHTALLGGRVRVPTLDGDVDVRVPSGTQPGEEMVLKGKGLPGLYGGGMGDLFVAFAVQLPRCVCIDHVGSQYVTFFVIIGACRNGSGKYCNSMPMKWKAGLLMTASRLRSRPRRGRLKTMPRQPQRTITVRPLFVGVHPKPRQRRGGCRMFGKEYEGSLDSNLHNLHPARHRQCIQRARSHACRGGLSLCFAPARPW